MPKPTAATINAHVGMRLKAARVAAEISQTNAANALELTFQQMQKYENNKNRISAGNLFILAKLYGKPVQWFFEGAP